MPVRLPNQSVATHLQPEMRMKWRLLAGTSLLALGTAISSAGATTFTFTGAIVDFTVPVTGTYQILAFGAQGGSAVGGNSGPSAPGGKGAEIGGDFDLTKDEVLRIAVGGAGGNGGNGFFYGGGGGGSFVIGPSNSKLVIAGGGGGSGGNGINGIMFVGSPGLTTLGGGSGTALSDVGGSGTYTASPGGTGGQGGGGGYGGSGGAGFIGGGAGGGLTSGGGGGGGIKNNSGISFYGGAGGGGGSFDGGVNQILMAGFQTGDGEVVITELVGATPVPEPASVALLSTGLTWLAAIRRRRR
jgi:hypothetical protein